MTAEIFLAVVIGFLLASTIRWAFYITVYRMFIVWLARRRWERAEPDAERRDAAQQAVFREALAQSEHHRAQSDRQVAAEYRLRLAALNTPYAIPIGVDDPAWPREVTELLRAAGELRNAYPTTTETV